MRILNLLNNSCRRFFANNCNFFQQQQHHSIRNWKKTPILYLSGILGGLYLAGNTLISDPENFHRKLLNVAMAQTSQEENRNKTRKTITLNFLADAVEIAAPAVVHVDVVSKHLYQETKSSGSGFIVTEAGMVLTNAHVIGNATKVNVRMSSGETYKGSVIDVDRETDLAAVKLDNKSNKKYPYLKLGPSQEVRAGEFVAALGSPLRLSNTVTSGIVSSLQRGSAELGMRKGMYYIQTDAAINVGNSGGPLINLDGEVIGINCITVQQAAGISFAIPSDIVSEFLDGAMKRGKDFDRNGGYFRKAKRNEKFYIGITMMTLSPQIIDELQRRNPDWFGEVDGGVLVTKVNRGSPSERSGLIGGDVILSINNQSVNSTSDVYEEVRKGDTMVIKARRGKNIVTLSVEPEVTSRL